MEVLKGTLSVGLKVVLSGALKVGFNVGLSEGLSDGLSVGLMGVVKRLCLLGSGLKCLSWRLRAAASAVVEMNGVVDDG